MFTLTFSFARTDHQAMLSFKSLAAVQAALETTKGADEDDTVAVKDDFGRHVSFKWCDLRCIVTEDVAKYWEGRNITSMIKLRAQHAFEMELKGDPTLSFLAGHQHPKFGDQS